jgi:hypothetical protein
MPLTVMPTESLPRAKAGVGIHDFAHKAWIVRLRTR